MWKWMIGMLAVVAAGCGGDSPPPPSAASDKPVVVATTTMIADLARRLVGDHATVIGIMRTGEDPHVYDPRPRDAQEIAGADLVLANGLHLEATLGHIIEHNARGKVVNLAEDPRITPLASADKLGAPDPHCWFDIRHFKVYVEKARDALIEIDPRNEQAYRANAGSYLAELDELHQWVREQLDKLPRQQRVMVTSHDAFQYFGAAYGVDVHAVIGMSTEQQPRPQDIERLEAQIREHSIRAVFVETSVSNTLNDIVRKVAQRTGAKIGGTLYSDSLGPPDEPTGSYLGMIRHNTVTLVEALR